MENTAYKLKFYILKRFLPCVYATLYLSLNTGSAAANIDAILALECPTTPQIWDLQPPPEQINRSNNLRRKTGSPYFAKGSHIILQGRILDEKCVPVPEAVVSIWHADASGHDPRTEPDASDSLFAGSGISITDNLGYFKFLTILPGSKGKMPPTIHMRVEHYRFPTLETQVFFPGHNNNADTNLQNHVAPSKRNLLIAKLVSHTSLPTESQDAKVYIFNVTLEGTEGYREY